MNITANKNLVKPFLSHFQKGGVNEILEMMSDDATWWVNGKPHLSAISGLRTKEEMRPVFNDLFAFFDGRLAMQLKSSIGEGDIVAAEARSLGETRSGRIYENEYHILFRIRGGKIAEVREYTDLLHTAEVMNG